MARAKQLELIHPGEILLEDFMKPLGVSQHKLSRDLDVPVSSINGIVNGRKSITADLALRIAKYFRTTPELWLGLQADYDIRRARRETWPRVEPLIRPIQAA